MKTQKNYGIEKMQINKELINMWGYINSMKTQLSDKRARQIFKRLCSKCGVKQY